MAQQIGASPPVFLLLSRPVRSTVETRIRYPEMAYIYRDFTGLVKASLKFHLFTHCEHSAFSMEPSFRGSDEREVCPWSTRVSHQKIGLRVDYLVLMGLAYSILTSHFIGLTLCHETTSREGA